MTIESSVLIPSNIPEPSVAEARAYFDNQQYVEAWNALALGGDRYADNAAGVLGKENRFAEDGGQYSKQAANDAAFEMKRVKRVG